MKMTFGTVLAGAALIVITVVFMTLGVSTLTFQPAPSDQARPLTQIEEEGRQIYMGNGCVYCHTQYVRPQDWTAAGGGKALRVAQAGDYVFQKTMLLGTERTGPDLSQEGGVHPDDWHRAHFKNPRYVSPNSIMPQFSFLSDDETTKLIAYVQSLGQKAADVRTGVQKQAKQDLVNSLQGKGGAKGTSKDEPYAQAHLDYLKSLVPPTWVNTHSAVPPTQRSLLHGKQIFTTNCIGCHGTSGAGDGPASTYLEPKPFNFTNADVQKQHSEGQYYHFILFGLPGSAMPAWGDYLTVQDIWDVINFLRTIPNGGLTVADQDLKPEMVVRGGAAGPDPAPYDQQNEDTFYGKGLNIPTPTPNQ
ncbi:MAG TPA: cbb3-type cytochrome c oxidase subunit II [Chloroflexia bacterium]|nr:cbb3-type cytochrome c oxidase subunit II [Chloroflexia bacterium]